MPEQFLACFILQVFSTCCPLTRLGLSGLTRFGVWGEHNKTGENQKLEPKSCFFDILASTASLSVFLTLSSFPPVTLARAALRASQS